MRFDFVFGDFIVYWGKWIRYYIVERCCLGVYTECFKVRVERDGFLLGRRGIFSDEAVLGWSSEGRWGC